MFSILPDLTPRDSHSLWYSSARNPNPSLSLFDPSPDHATLTNNPGTDPTTTTNPNQANPSRPAATQSNSHPHAHHSPATTAQLIERSALGRLRADELLLERRRAAVTNLGSMWLKPPGVSKTLFQMREERREAEEHAEAMRREMLAQELAEAEAEAAAAAAAGGGGVGVVMGEEGGETGDLVMEVELEDADEAGMVDLDEEIPDADEGGFGYDGISDGEEEDEEEEDEEEEEEEEEEEDDEEDDEEEEGHDISRTEALQQRRAQQRELADRMAHMRAAEERMRQMMVRGGQGGSVGEDLYEGEEEIEAEERTQLLDEDDLLGGGPALREDVVEPGMDMDMDANLDDDVPEAESGGYEHTDSEASLDSDEEDGDEDEDEEEEEEEEDDDRNLSYARSSHVLHRNSLRRGDLPRSSLDISGFLSRDGSSIMGSSPQIRRSNPQD